MSFGDCAGSGCGSHGRFGDDRPCRGFCGSNRGCLRRGGDDAGPRGTRGRGRDNRRRLTRLRHDDSLRGSRFCFCSRRHTRGGRSRDSRGGCSTGDRRFGRCRGGRCRYRSSHGPGDRGRRGCRPRCGRALHLLLLFFQNGFGHIADTVNPGPVDLRLDFGVMPSRRAAAGTAPFEDVRAHTFGFIRLNRARMRFLFRDTDCHESVQNFFALDFQLSR